MTHGNNLVNVEVGPLNNVTSPEEKRKIIGDTFMKVGRWYGALVFRDANTPGHVWWSVNINEIIATLLQGGQRNFYFFS